MKIVSSSQIPDYDKLAENNNISEGNSNSIFAIFNDKDGKIDSGDVKYVKEGVVSQEITNFFKEFTGKTQKWTKELKQRFTEIINNFNNSMKNSNIEDDFAEMSNLELRPYQVIYEQGKVVQKLCLDADGEDVVVIYENNRIKEVQENDNTTYYSYTGDLLTKKTNTFGNVTEYKYNNNNMIEQQTTTDKDNNIRQTNFVYNEKNQLVKEIRSSSYYDKEKTEDVIFVHEYDENNNRTTRAFLADGREFENYEDAEFYLVRLYISASFTGEKNIQDAVKSFKFVE